MDFLLPSCILTARIDEKSQAFFDEMRSRYFPAERNLLRAHLTLFHKLPHTSETKQVLSEIIQKPIRATVGSLKNIGNGVAYFIESPELIQVHRNLRQQFLHYLSLQDQQGIRPHITIQNKVKPEVARALLKTLQRDFEPFNITIHGLDFWHYLNGPWEHDHYFPFNTSS